MAEPVEPDGTGVVPGEQETEVLVAPWARGDSFDWTEPVPGAGAELAWATRAEPGTEETSGEIVLTMKSAARTNAWARAGRRMFTLVIFGRRPTQNQKGRHA